MKQRMLTALAAGLLLATMTACGGGTMGSGAESGPAVISAVSASCTPAMVSPSAASQCAATVQGSGPYSSTVVWTANVGTITAAGLLTAPGAAGSVTVTAASTQDTTKSGTATVTVQAAAPTISSVAVTCMPASVTVGGTSQCAATVQGTGSYSSAVVWTASAGSITPGGLLTAPTAAGSVTVTAASTQDTTKSGTATVTVQAAAATISSVAVTCTPASVTAGGTSQCAATVQGTGSYSSAVVWTASAGSISPGGLLTAPATAATVTVTAASTQDTTQSGTATVTVQAAAPTISSVAVTCTPSSITVGGTSQCAAAVQGTGSYTPAVTWSASGGTISPGGLLTAPPTAASVTVTATSTQDTTKAGSATVTVQAAAPTITAVAVTCTPATIAVSSTSQCAATVQGTGSFSGAVTWGASGGAITASGLFTAPATGGSITVTAASMQDPTKVGTVIVSVVAAPAITSVAVTCTPTTIVVSGTSQCSAAVQGTGSYSSTVTWAATGGAITASGLLTAPANPGGVTVTATSTQDTTKSASALITVQATAPTITAVTVTCNPSTVAPNTTSQCTAAVQGTGSFSSTVTWSASEGTINATGLFTAQATAGSATVTATSTQLTTQSGTADITVQLQVPASKHVVLVMEENQSYSTVVGQAAVWPNFNHLISGGALPTRYYANSHPSIGNYFMLTTGQLLTTNDQSTTVWDVDNIARRMLAKGTTFKVYAESISRGYLGGNSGPYLLRHNPFAMLSDIADSAQVANEIIWPFSQFAIDVANNALPEFSYIVPNVDDDAHNGTPQQADTWLQANVVTPLSGYPAFQAGGDGVLIVDFDEAEDSDITYGGGHVAPVLWGPQVQVGYTQQSSTDYRHPSMLLTVMEALGLNDPPGLAGTAPSMAEFFVQQ